MASNSTTSTSRIDWPTGFERTPERERDPNNDFRVSLSDAFDDLERELERLGADSYRYEFDAQQRKTDQRPYARANPDDPGFVLRWRMDDADYAVACDTHTRLRDNVRQVGLYLREKRKMENRPVQTGESEFANARLPPADEAGEAVVSSPPAHEVLGVSPDASDEEIREAYRERAKETHSDLGGSDQAFKRVRNAKEELLDGE